MYQILGGAFSTLNAVLTYSAWYDDRSTRVQLVSCCQNKTTQNVSLHLRRPSLLEMGVFCNLTLSRVRPLSSKACMRDISTCPSSLVNPALCACSTLSARALSSPSFCSSRKREEKRREEKRREEKRREEERREDKTRQDKQKREKRKEGRHAVVVVLVVV